jgi:hypothetical protein
MDPKVNWEMDPKMNWELYLANGFCIEHRTIHGIPFKVTYCIKAKTPVVD